MRSLVWLIQRVPVLYLAGFLVFYSMVNYQDVTDKARVASVNRLMPSIDFLVDFIREEKSLSRSYMKEWVMYYRALREISGPRADVDGMLGFFSYYLGQKDRAIKYFEEAIIGNPLYLWFYYDMAVMYYEEGNYEKALEYVQLAVDRDEETTNSFLNVAKPYNDLLQPLQNKTDLLHDHFQMGRMQMFKMLILCQYNLKHYPQVVSLSQIAIATLKQEQHFFYFYSGLAALEMKEYRGAMFYFEECIKLSDKYADAFYYYSVTNKMLGNDLMANQLMTAAVMMRKHGAAERPVLDGLKVRVF